MMVQSTSDERTVNNVMRHEYRVLSDAEKQLMKDLKDIGLSFVEKCNEIGKVESYPWPSPRPKKP